MKFAKRSLLQGSVCLMLASCNYAQADWAQSTDALVVNAMPTNLQTQVQNPPTFTWARHPTNFASYTLEIRSGSNVVKTFTTTRNWYLPSTRLPVGSYTWRVRPSSGTEWSADRAFVITADAQVFEVPENAALRTAIMARARPRGLQSGLPLASSWSAAIKAERANALQGMTNEVIKQITGVPVAQDAKWPLVAAKVITAAFSAQATDIRKQINLSGRQLEASALLYRLTGEQRFLNEALLRGDQLAALDPDGPTSYINQDQGTRVIALSLIKAVDSLGTALDATRRAKWLNIVAVRTDDIYQDLAGSNGRMDQYPYDSHGGTNLGFLAVIATLSLGDIPAATTWFDFSFRAYVSSLMAWSGPEGGFAGGTAYAEYAVDYSLQIWQPLLQATGVNLFEKPWSSGLAQFFIYFVPPGVKNHLFGDGHESAPEFKFLKAFASRIATPSTAWYMKSLTGNEDMLTLLQAPFPLPANTVTPAAPTANTALFSSIGWSAMHSKLSDLNRTSVYFKASPYGSFNHSHGNQNGLVVTSAGIPLLSETGYYDWYDSPLFNSWYRQTKAANALTFDGGVGQMIDGYRETLTRNGAITAFSSTPAIDFVQGDATAAYGGALTSAVRQVWYLRDTDAVVVRDKASSVSKRLFEWNFHAPVAMVLNTNGSVSISNQGRTACVTPLTTTNLRFEKRAGPAPKAGTVEDHGVFVSTATATSADFLVLIDVGCKKPAVKLSNVSGGRTLTVGTQSILLAN